MLAHKSTPQVLARIEAHAAARGIEPMFLRLAWCVAACRRSFVGYRVMSWGTNALCAMGVIDGLRTEGR